MALSSKAELLNEALALHRRGALANAAALYAEVLRTDPGNSDACYYLGMMACNEGRFTEGLELARKSLANNLQNARAEVLLGRSLAALGSAEEALARFDRAIVLAPDLAPAHASRADLLSDLGRSAEAVEGYDQALLLAPQVAEDWFNRGVALGALGRFDEALASCGKAIEIKPNVAQMHLMRAQVLSNLHRYQDALADLEEALRIEPRSTDAWLSCANILRELERHEQSLSACDRVLAIKTDAVNAWLLRSNLLCALRRYDEALTSSDRALALVPDRAEAWLGRGNIFFNRKQYQDAAAAYKRALELDSDLAPAWLFYGSTLLQLNQYDRAFTAYHKAASLDPDMNYALGHGLFAQLNMCDWKALEANTGQLLLRLAEGKRVSMPFALLTIRSTAAEQLQCAELYAKSMEVFSPVWRGEVYSHDRIRIAYLSADFHEHPVAHLIAGLFEHHDTSRFEVTGLSFGSGQNSAMRERIEAALEHFFDVQNRSDAEVADLIRQLEIDIFVDLMGHTQNARFGILARRPAPIQAHYLGYPGTTGASLIDYIIADSTVIPEEHFPFYSERAVWLPDTYQANDDKRHISGRKPARRECGLSEDAFVFCCFNSTYKITSEIFDVWMRLLAVKANSVLWLIETNPTAEANLRREAERRGIASGRLVFAPKMPLADHLARSQCADLFLDTLPYNAHTTASDALWAGLPVLTCLGETFAGRVAGSLLRAVGLPELITTSPEDYGTLALKLANEPSFLASIKAKLARNRDTYPLFDTARVTRYVEAAYTTMWERHQRGEPPETFAVKPID